MTSPGVWSRGGQVLDLGRCDVAVVGGGVAGSICAGRLAAHGLSTVVLEARSSLMWEITRSRRTSVRVDEVVEYSPTSAAFFDSLAALEGVRKSLVEPVATQHAADAFLLERQVRLLFQARPLDVRREGVGQDEEWRLRVALKGTVGELRARSIVDCSDNGLVLRTGGAAAERTVAQGVCWALVFTACAIDALRTLTVRVEGREAQVRICPTFRRGEVQVDVAWPAEGEGPRPDELAFGADVVPLLSALRQAVPELSEAVLAYVCEEPWAAPAVRLSAGKAHHAGGSNGAAKDGLHRVGGLLTANGNGDAEVGGTGGAHSTGIVPLYREDFPSLDPGWHVTGAGRWLEKLGSASGAMNGWEALSADVSNLFLLGEAVGAVVAETTDGAVGATGAADGPGAGERGARVNGVVASGRESPREHQQAAETAGGGGGR